MKKILFSFRILLLVTITNASQLLPDTLQKRIYAWQLNDDFYQISPIDLDTTLKKFQVYKPDYKLYPLHSNMGNLALASLPDRFIDRNYKDRVFFIRYYLPFLHYPDNQIYINTKIPFTELKYTTGGQKKVIEQSLRVLHSQNINDKLNAGVDFKLFGSEGQYVNQKSSIKALTVFTSYTSNRYTLHANFNINNIFIDENGGMVNDEDLGNMETLDIPVNLGTLNSAVSSIKNKTFMLSHGITLGGGKRDTTRATDSTVVKIEKPTGLGLRGKLSHVLFFQNDAKIYRDKSPQSGFYRDIYSDSTLTFDSLYARTFTNVLRFDFQSDPGKKFGFGGGVAATIEMDKYSNLLPGDTVYHDDDYSNKSLSGYLFNDLGEKFNWKVKARNYYSGYKAGDFLLDGSINKSFSAKKGVSTLTLAGKFETRRPAYWLNYYHSNNFVWENDFSDVIETRISAKYSHPGRYLNASFNYALIDRYLYFDTLAHPAQIDGLVSILSLYLTKDFHLGKFHFLNKVLFQQTDHQREISLPAISIYNSIYFEHDFYFKLTQGHLLVQLGFDVYYNTPYNAMAYMPATGQFYIQDEKELGNYPYMDVFLNFKLKRTRFFFMFDHVNSGFTGNNYFSVLHYPLNQRTLKFGLSWTFYD